ncbi:arylsulfatase [Polynucleobacter sp. IMCC 29146]|uniref:arylsulfatase n=1 Tax=Polynucleobacter sp. IMCC 29146 TaxID=2780953 RepID=UPI001F22CC1F|nr:arylsulfatase [Polynucleobacter sp. IMCC 29146]MCE7530697.1 arylsulfatase [Polynucleobacter sp. IMCC 29146]
MKKIDTQPNVVLILADNLGWGELGCYGGGAIRGAPTPRIDALAQEGTRFLNFNVESDCVPTRSALMTGRHPIRTGAIQSVPAGLPQGIIPWEKTMAELFSEAGYATAMFGKWHLGDKAGRYPNDKGFDEWYGIPRTTNESMFFDSIGYDQSVVEAPYVMEGKKGNLAEKKELYDLEMRRKIDAELTKRSCEFIHRNANKKPFFLYVPLTQLHFPTLPHRDFEGNSNYGDFADSLIEMDARVGQIMDAINQDDLAENTIFIFASDNGPEYRRPWRGSAGMWTGTYHTAMEGALRVPLIIRWPNKIPAGKVTNEIIHVVDLLPTLAHIADLKMPIDRPIDGIDQSQFLLGKEGKSNREGFVYFIKTELRAAKWRDWKMHFVWEVEPNAGANHLETPYLFNIVQDPKEESDVNTTQGWVRGPIRKMVINFQNSLKTHPPIPPGASDDFKPI